MKERKDRKRALKGGEGVVNVTRLDEDHRRRQQKMGEGQQKMGEEQQKMREAQRKSEARKKGKVPRGWEGGKSLDNEGEVETGDVVKLNGGSEKGTMKETIRV